MIIPKRFKLHGDEIEVVYDTKLNFNTENRGEAQFRRNLIVLAPPTEDNPTPLTQTEQTFCHELFHYLFYHAGYQEDMGDEIKIERLSRLLHQALTTMEY